MIPRLAASVRIYETAIQVAAKDGAPALVHMKITAHENAQIR